MANLEDDGDEKKVRVARMKLLTVSAVSHVRSVEIDICFGIRVVWPLKSGRDTVSPELSGIINGIAILAPLRSLPTAKIVGEQMGTPSPLESESSELCK